MSLIEKKAPKFSSDAVLEGNKIVSDFSLEQYINEKYVVLFFYPKDFTFVCPTELHAFQDRLNEFENRNVQIVGVSTDTAESHWSWLQIGKEQGGIKGITYPIVADTSKVISDTYGVLAGEYSYNEEGKLDANGPMIAYRGLFIIDTKGIVHHSTINNFPLGRNVDEVLRVIDSLQHFEKNGEVCPANWKQGEKALNATPEGVAEYFQ